MALESVPGTLAELSIWRIRGRGIVVQVSISVSAELGELAVFVSGRTADVWWPPEVGFPHLYN